MNLIDCCEQKMHQRACNNSFVRRSSGERQQAGELASRAADSLRARGAPLSSRLRPLPASSSSRHFPSAKPSRRSSLPWLVATLALFSCCLGAALLWVGLPSHESSSPEYHSSSPLNEVTYGSVVKLMHERTGYRLHSHDIPYGSGSGQQSVTSFAGVEDANSYWVVKEAKDSPSLQGVTISHGGMLRLQHMQTRKWLHSHLYQSPITGNLEVSCFGGEGESDSGDLWILELINVKDSVWTRDQKVRFQHVDTGAYLHSHDKKYSRIAGGQQEVCGVKKKSADNVWIATEGVYLFPSHKGAP